MSLFSVLSDAFGGFFRSAADDRDRYQARHPDRATYAPKITRRHEQWPGGSGQERPFQSWPGGDRHDR